MNRAGGEESCVPLLGQPSHRRCSSARAPAAAFPAIRPMAIASNCRRSTGGVQESVRKMKRQIFRDLDAHVLYAQTPKEGSLLHFSVAFDAPYINGDVDVTSDMPLLYVHKKILYLVDERR